MTTLENRLTKLERKVRIYQVAFLSIVVVSGFFIATGFNHKYKAPDLIQAKEFQIVDDNGKVYGSLKQHDGFFDFKVYNGSGNRIMRLTESEGGGGAFSTYNQSGTEIIALLPTTENGGTIEVNNKSGNMVAKMGVDVEGEGAVSIYNRNKKRTALIGHYGSGDGCLNVYNSSGAGLNGVWPK